jgi:hypothetical protein
LQQSCNKVATKLQQSCNKVATKLQQSCNKVATKLQQSCIFQRSCKILTTRCNSGSQYNSQSNPMQQLLSCCSVPAYPVSIQLLLYMSTENKQVCTHRKTDAQHAGEGSVALLVRLCMSEGVCCWLTTHCTQQ